jgi:hypothetical protein
MSSATRIVVNKPLTIHRSATNRIEAGSKANAEKMFELQKQALQSNTSLLQLVQDIHSLLRSVTSAPKSSTLPTMNLPKGYQPNVHTDHFNLTMADGSGAPQDNIQTMNPHYRPVALKATSEVPARYDNIAIPFRPLISSREIPSTDSATSSYAALKPKAKIIRELPAKILEINVRRQSSGSKAFQEYKEKHFPSKAMFEPSLHSLEITTTAQLHDSLTHLFRPFIRTRVHQASLDRDHRKDEMVRWTRKLEQLLHSSISESASSPTFTKEAVQANQNAMVDLLVRLNASIEKCDEKTRRLFYQGTEQAGIDRVLRKLQTVSKSVRAMKEVEEFEDAREEWKDGQIYV